MGILSSFNFGITEFFGSLVTLTIIYVTHYYYKYFTRPNPLPGPFPLPIVGNLYLFKLDDYSKFAKYCHKKYGDIFELYIRNDRQIFIGRLDVIDKLFNPSSKTNFKSRTLYEPGLKEFGISGCGVGFNYDYNAWQFNRQFFTQALLTPSFSQLSLVQSQKFIEEVINGWNDLSDNNIEFDLKRWMFSFTIDLSLDLFIGKRGYAMDNYYSKLTGKESKFTNVSDNDRAYVDYLSKYVEAFVFHLFFGSFAKYVPILSGIAKTHIDNRDRIWNLVYNIIDEQKKIIANTPKDQLRNDMINLFLTANTDHDINISKNRIKDILPEFQRPMNDKELIINLLEAIIGGVDSISSFFTSMIYYIVKNPDVVTKLRTEIVDILGKDPRPINVEDLDKFKYIEAVIKEVSRIISLTPLVERYNEEPDEVAGYQWPANTHFIVNSSGTHSDDKFWDKPENFDPERFINPSNVNNTKALILFGGGIRICPGRKLAMVEMKVLIASLIHQFDFELVNPNEPIKLKYEVFNQPHELYIRVKKRVF